jgi:peptide/nickel transport system substrate-binding protein
MARLLNARRRANRWAPLASVLLCATLLLAACDVRLPFTGTSTAPHRGGSIVDAILGETASLIPAQGQVSMDLSADQALWAPLWYGDPTGALHPGLARQVPSVENGDVSADLKTWTIRLKPDLKWSNGSPLTADDVAFSLNTFADPHFARTNGFPLHDPADATDFLGATALDTTTVRFTLAHPNVTMTALLADGSDGPIPAAVFGGMAPGDIPKSPENFVPTVTSGPFKVADRAQGDHITLIRNPYYYQGPDKPYLDQITLKVFPTADAVLAAAQTRTLDVAYAGVSNVSAHLLDSYRALPGYTTQLDRYPSGYDVIVFNLTNPILSDKVVRQALARSLDPRQVIALGEPGIYVPICDDHAGTFAHEPNLTCYPQDPAKARQMLDQDGWTLGADGFRHKDGKTLELGFTVGAFPIHPARAIDARLVPAAWATIGVKIDNNTASRRFPSDLNNGNYDIWDIANGTGYDPDDHLFLMCGQTPDKGGGNFTRYCNPAVDQAEILQLSTTDPATRMEAFHAIHQLVLDDVPMIFLYTELGVGIFRSSLRNYKPFDIGRDLWNCWEWYLDQG